ncbi:MAG TPA: hypothetical protein VGT40_22215 [Methylomirabilota bacterium]|jgi:hypothetical protein|nr:hypothetical protein [Methylomirabilota bacterium]
MFRFILGAIVGGIAMWVWRDDIREYMDRRTRSVRLKAADQLRAVQQATESALDAAKQQISSRLQSGEEAIRPPMDNIGAAR